MNSSCSHIRRSSRQTSQKKCSCHGQNFAKPIKRRASQKRRQNLRARRLPRSFSRKPMTERRAHIAHQYGELHELISQKCRLIARCVRETRGLLTRQLHARLIYRSSRYVTLKLWVPNAVFANLVLPHVDEDDLKWTITKLKQENGVVVKASTTSLRGTLTMDQFTQVFQARPARNALDSRKIAYHASILFDDDDNPFRFSYNIDTGLLTLRCRYRIFRINADGVAYDI